ncbi:MAG: hypothetical protein GYB31_17625 [Bacteroidetes bacterium]|nr:hypothetical protein [Bacteroidota bacterium]
MKKLRIISIFSLLLGLGACCSDYTGYGRYTLTEDCQTVTIDGTIYQLTTAPNGTELAIDGHTLGRGIYRKTRPWLYVHTINMASKTANITFDAGSKPSYPIYTGSTASIFQPFSQAWNIERSTCVAFDNDYWLVAHRWDSNGVYFDLQQRQDNDNTRWNLITPDIYVTNGGAAVPVAEISTEITITAHDDSAKTATVEFNGI